MRQDLLEDLGLMIDPGRDTNNENLSTETRRALEAKIVEVTEDFVEGLDFTWSRLETELKVVHVRTAQGIGGSMEIDAGRIYTQNFNQLRSWALSSP
jgi:hypothetical protein